MMRAGERVSPGLIHSRKEVAMSKKTNCPITREQFRSRARPVSITVCDVPMVVPTKEFSTGSLGWYLNGKTVIEIDGTPVQVQLGLSLTIIGSKELPADAPAPTQPVQPVQPVAAA
jgi:hypothetical protein